MKIQRIEIEILTPIPEKEVGVTNLDDLKKQVLIEIEKEFENLKILSLNTIRYSEISLKRTIVFVN